MTNIFVVGGDSLVEAMFESRSNEYKIVKHRDEADLIVFTGGADVGPELYGEKNFASYTNEKRDVYEIGVFTLSKEDGLPMVGICRGAQFLNVMNEGKMFQDVTRHTRYHKLTDLASGEQIDVTSTHHQMMIPNFETAEVLAIANEGGVKHRLDKNGVVTDETDDNDTEVVWYEDTLSLCFQPHPEYGKKSCEDYFFKLLEEKIGL